MREERKENLILKNLISWLNNLKSFKGELISQTNTTNPFKLLNSGQFGFEWEALFCFKNVNF